MVSSSSSGRFTLEVEAPLPIAQEFGCAPQPIYARWWRENLFLLSVKSPIFIVQPAGWTNVCFQTWLRTLCQLRDFSIELHVQKVQKSELLLPIWRSEFKMLARIWCMLRIQVFWEVTVSRVATHSHRWEGTTFLAVSGTTDATILCHISETLNPHAHRCEKQKSQSTSIIHRL